MTEQLFLRETINNIVTPEEAKAFLRVTDSAEDDIIDICLSSALSYVEGRLGYIITDRAYILVLRDYAGETVEIPGSVEITSVLDAEGVAAEYTATPQADGLQLQIISSGDSFFIDYTAHPRPLADRRHVIQALLMCLAKFYEQRGDEGRADTEGGWATIDRLLGLVAYNWL